jgi:hypothetical protein
MKNHDDLGAEVSFVGASNSLVTLPLICCKHSSIHVDGGGRHGLPILRVERQFVPVYTSAFQTYYLPSLARTR